MASSLVVASLLLLFVVANSQGPWLHCNQDSTSNNQVSTNIDNVLAAITSAAANANGFSAHASGAGSDVVYGLAQCRGDLDLTEGCYPCIQEATQEIRLDCPGASDAQIWYDHCTIRYSLANFFGTFNASQKSVTYNREDYPDPEALSSQLGILFDELTKKAADPASRGFAKGQVDLNDHTLYGTAQCTTDLRPEVCAQCLDAAVKQFDYTCKPKKGCRVFLSSCSVRYELYEITSRHEKFGRAKQINKLRSRKSMLISMFKTGAM